MNVLYISSKRSWGGVVTWLKVTAEALNKRGHKVWLITHPYLPVEDNAMPGMVLRKALGPDYNPLMLLFLVRFIKKNRVDLVITNIQKEVIAGGLAAKVCSIPNIRIIGSANDINARIRKRQERFVTHSIIPCDYVFNKAAQREDWLKRGDFTTIYNGRNLAEYSKAEILAQRREWGLDSSHIILGVICKLGRVKNIAGLLNAFPEIVRKRENVRLVIVGEGPEKKSLMAQADALQITDNVVFAGFTVKPLLCSAAFDVGIINSFSEALPFSLMEYMAAGRAVISTNVGGIGEVIEDGHNGLLIEAGNEAQLTKALFSLIDDPELRARLASNALESIVKRFSEDKMIEKTEETFRKIIEKEDTTK